MKKKSWADALREQREGKPIEDVKPRVGRCGECNNARFRHRLEEGKLIRVCTCGDTKIF